MFMQDITRFASDPIQAQDASQDAAAPTGFGLVAGTRVETETGWRAIETLHIGDSLHTLDGGLARIVAMNRREVLPGEPVIRIAGGTFDACSDLLLMPGQDLLLDTMGLTDAPYACLSAETLAGRPGVSRAATPRRVEIVTPIFAEEEAVWAQSGVLLRCPGVRPDAVSAYPRLQARAAGVFLDARHHRSL
ncbi:Hint domain-containing protein [Xinfangfangia pollutisoli]|uniref:Hint domain-containing protein n=1 Tax=Xinfangfangia pollutisoli TaxID=2865960 RepID=UPI001CD1DFC4|nr:Hint domain-containing protein [Xinfangfangia pollutisoli]